MATVTFSYIVGQLVWTVNNVKGVRAGVIKSVTVVESASTITPSIDYVVQYKLLTNGSESLPQNSVYPDVDLALAGYKLLIT